MNTALLRDLTQDFAANRPLVSKAIRELYAASGDDFLKEAAVVLRESEESAGTLFVLTLLSTRPDFLQFLCDSDLFTPPQSAGLIRQVKSLDPRVEWKLANMVARLKGENATEFGAHCLEVLGSLCEDAAALPALRELLSSPNPRVRSKAALLIGRISRNPQWAKMTDANQDTRVVANAVESIWGLDSAVAKEVFRDAVSSNFHRSAVNGAVGLYLAREQEAIARLFYFARDPQCDFRAAAAWGMGRTGDPRFLKTLDVLCNDPGESVRSTAAAASHLLHQRTEHLKDAPEIAMLIPTADFRDGRHTVRVLVEDPAKVLDLDALHFAITNGATPVEQYTFRRLASDAGRRYEIGFRGPRSVSRMITVELFTDRGCGAASALETGSEEMKPIAEILRKLH